MDGGDGRPVHLALHSLDIHLEHPRHRRQDGAADITARHADEDDGPQRADGSGARPRTLKEHGFIEPLLCEGVAQRKQLGVTKLDAGPI